MRPAARDLARFYIGFAIPIIILAVSMLFCGVLLERAGEYWSLPEIRRHLEKTGGVYGSAVNSRLFWFKQEIYQQVKPDIATLGSSRVLQFRKQFFSRPFANLGNMHNLDDVTEMAQSMFTVYPPKVLILGLDFWWFSPIYHNLEYTRSPKETAPTSSDIFQTANWVLSGKIPPSVIKVILQQSSPNLGIQGITKSEGIDASGSFIHSALLDGSIPHYDPMFKDTLQKITHGDKMFSYSSYPDPQKIVKLDKLLSFLHDLPTQVVVVIPPLTPKAIDAMAEHPEQYAYIAQALAHVQQRAHEYGFSYFNFHDPRLYGSSDCEMLDGIHGGPVTYARMLKEIVLKEEGIRGFVDLSAVEAAIIAHSGKASFVGSREIDFLKIGCRK